MATPAFNGSCFRPVFLGICAAVSGAFCLGMAACGEKSGAPASSPSDGMTDAGSAGALASAGTSSVGGMTPGTVGGSATTTGGVSSAGTATGGAGGTSAGGTSNGGSASAGAAQGGSGAFDGTAQRPQLPAASADNYTVLKYLEKTGAVAAPQTDAWDPTAGVGDVATLTAKYKVAASGGTDTTIQSAIDKAVAAGGTDRVAIEVADGTYREVVCVPTGAPPITLFSKNSDASATRIVFDNYAGKAKEAQTPANPCNPALGAVTYGTSGSPTFAAYANGFYAKNLTFENDIDETGLSGSVQAVALVTQGDKQIYENVRLLGNQDTFFVKSANADVIARVYVTKSFIQGDTDFVFGRGTLVIDQSEIHFISTRQGSKGYAIVPSTDARNPYGILVYKSQFTADAATTNGSINLGRAWDESGKDLATYAAQAMTGVYPNGQALIRECTLGAHIAAAPWAEAATTKRPFSAVAGAYPANRLFELKNTGPGAATTPIGALK
ncbi:MAG TPA: pectinesterase family protein [Polyangiaceae bacterium]|nr:pectinesterase family protein [Polyangiaceae bacterium]